MLKQNNKREESYYLGGKHRHYAKRYSHVNFKTFQGKIQDWNVIFVTLYFLVTITNAPIEEMPELTLY